MREHFTDSYLRDLDDDMHGKIEAIRGVWGVAPVEFYPKLNDWFSNFDERDKPLALKLFRHLDYLSDEQFARRVDNLWNRIRQVLYETDHSVADLLLVVPDLRADSADRHAYDVIKSWGLTQQQVVTASSLKDAPAGRILVFFNDTHGTGNQFVREMTPLIPEDRFRWVFIIAVTIGERALRRFKSELRHARILPDRATPSVRDLFTAVEVRRLHELGAQVYPAHPMGYGDAGLLTAYSFQCPNNTLPLIWADGTNNTVEGRAYPWKPLCSYKPKLKPAARLATSKPESPSPALLDPSRRWKWTDNEHAKLVACIASWGCQISSFYQLAGHWFDNFRPHEREVALDVFLATSHLDITGVRRGIRQLRKAILTDIKMAGGDSSDIVLVTTGDNKNSVYHYVFDFLHEWHMEVDQVRSLERLTPEVVIDKTLVLFYHTRSGDHVSRARADGVPYVGALRALAPRTMFFAAYATTPAARNDFAWSRLEYLRDISGTVAELVPQHAAQIEALERELQPGNPRPPGEELLVAYYFQCPKASSPLLWADRPACPGRRPWRPLFRNIEIPE